MIEPSAWTAIGGASSPSFSGDGGTVFHLRGAGLAQVWSMRRDGSASVQLASQDEQATKLRRAPNSDQLLWSIDAGGNERHQVWLLDPGGTPRALTSALDASHDLGAFSPDGARIAFAANDRDIACFDIVVMDLATGDRRRVFEGAGTRSVTNWAGTRLAVIEDRSSGDQSLWTIDADGHAAHEVPRRGLARYAAARFAKDGPHILALSDQGGADFMRLCRIEPGSGEVQPVFEPAGRDVEAWALSPDGSLLATVENDRSYGVLRVGPLGGEREIVSGLPRGVAGDLAWSPDGTALAFSAEGPTDPPGIYLWEAGAVRPLWQPDVQAAAGVNLAQLAGFTLVSWPGLDGQDVPGWLAMPHGEAPAGGFPSVVWVHGGPAAQSRAKFRPDMQMLLSQGFAVLMPNVRGSTGYGRTWMESDDFGKRQVAIDDLAAARHWLAVQPDVDPARIGIMGQSYGGWMVLAAITRHPELWRAAVDCYGIADWFTLLRDTGPWRRQHRALEYGVPGRHDDVLRELSPIHGAGAVSAPLLVAHGDRDPRVPMNESEQFVAAMERHQKRVRYERFTYAGHGFIRPDHQRRIYAAVAEHFLEHL
jgi:dipeptidyl aminopeptidase/acylaminoacyl peptidase